MENGCGRRETKRLKRSHAETKAGGGPAEAPAQQAAAAVSAEDDLLLLEAGGSSEAALLELQVPARCHARPTEPRRGVCLAACCTRCRRACELESVRTAARSVQCGPGWRCHWGSPAGTQLAGQAQARELVAEVRVDYAREDALDALVARLRAALTRLPERVLEPGAGDGFAAALGVPPVRAHGAAGPPAPAGRAGRSRAARAAQKRLRFRPPARVEVVGSYALRAAARPHLTVDVAVEAPAACFDAKDQLNNLYFDRRRRWLAALAAGLRRKAAFRQQRWEFLDDDARCAPAAAHKQRRRRAGRRTGCRPAAARATPRQGRLPGEIRVRGRRGRGGGAGAGACRPGAL